MPLCGRNCRRKASSYITGRTYLGHLACLGHEYAAPLGLLPSTIVEKGGKGTQFHIAQLVELSEFVCLGRNAGK